MSKKKKQRQLNLEAQLRMKKKDRQFFDDQVAGFGSMQKPKIKANQVEGDSIYNKSPEELIIGKRTDEGVGRS